MSTAVSQVLQSCADPVGRYVFVEKIKSILAKPNTMEIVRLDSEKVPNQARYAILVDFLAEGKNGTIDGVRVLGYVEESATGCTAYILEFNPW